MVFADFHVLGSIIWVLKYTKHGEERRKIERPTDLVNFLLVCFWVDKWKFDQFVDVNIISKVYRCCLSGHRVAVFGGARRRRADPTRHVSDPFRERGSRDA
jgi:hypothetical protein